MNTKLLAQVDFKGLNDSLKTQNFKFADSSLGDIINALLKYLFVFAGLALLAYLIIGGFSLMTSGGDPKKVEAGKGAITNAILGFLIIFAAYWITQIVALVFNLNVGVFK
jgi:hypothetical protein